MTINYGRKTEIVYYSGEEKEIGNKFSIIIIFHRPSEPNSFTNLSVHKTAPRNSLQIHKNSQASAVSSHLLDLQNSKISSKLKGLFMWTTQVLKFEENK